MAKESTTLTHDEFLSKLKEKNRYAYDTLTFNEKYINNKTPIVAECKYGLIKITPMSLLSGSLWSILSAVDSHSYFLNMLKEKNFDAYNSISFKEKYKNNSTPLLAECKYGSIKISPSNLLIGRMYSIESALNKNEYFLNLLKEKNIHAYNNYKLKGDYYSHHGKVIMETMYGDISISPSDLLQGNNGDIRSAVNKDEYFKNKLRHMNPECFEKIIKFNSNFEKSSEYIYFDTKYGECKIKPNNMFSGTVPDIQSALNKTEYFINMAKEKHGDKYDYSDVKYIKNNKPVKIKCKKHGMFMQSPNTHISANKGCPHCGRESSVFYKETWSNAPNSSKTFDEFKLYKLRCWDDEEEFYKIGITFRKIEERFSNEKEMPYHYEILEIISSDNGEYIWDLEKKLHDIHKNNKMSYIPKKEFSGRYECFKSLIDFGCCNTEER